MSRETERLAHLRSRPVLAQPSGMVSVRHDDLVRLRDRSTMAIEGAVAREADRVSHLRAHVRSLSPQNTLDRGYAVVQNEEGDVVRTPDQAPLDSLLAIRVAGGRISARSETSKKPIIESPTSEDQK